MSNLSTKCKHTINVHAIAISTFIFGFNCIGPVIKSKNKDLFCWSHQERKRLEIYPTEQDETHACCILWRSTPSSGRDFCWRPPEGENETRHAVYTLFHLMIGEKKIHATESNSYFWSSCYGRNECIILLADAMICFVRFFEVSKNLFAEPRE